MKFSELWLREWVNPAINSKTLGHQLTMLGFEVNCVNPASGQFAGVVVGLIIACQRHATIKQLFVTKVDIGKNHFLNIVCSASNCRTNLRVAVATVDATLFSLGKKDKTDTTLVHGEPTEGLLCSFFDLGITSNHNDIIELPEDAPIGQDIRTYLKMNDNIIDINVTPNRGDCLSLLGIARDVATYNRLPLFMPTIKTIFPQVSTKLSVCIDPKTKDACQSYAIRVIENINVRANTPLWMIEKLRRCGLQSINVVKDISNYVLLELGQPISVFNKNYIEGNMVLRYSRLGESFTLLDRSNITLFPKTLVVADQRQILAIAGVSFVNAPFNISLNTQNIVLSCASFNPLVITNGVRRYQLWNDDILHRYELGIDPMIQHYAIERATELLITICNGRPGPVFRAKIPSANLKLNSITLRKKNLYRLVGHFIPDKTVIDILTRLGFQVGYVEHGWKVITPSWRFDISFEEDLIGEIIRMYGYDLIPNIPICTSLLMSSCDHEPVFPLTRAKKLLADRGYREVITYSFVDVKKQTQLHPEQKSMALLNPVSKNMSVMRLSLWTGLLAVATYNQNRQHRRIRLFESGLCFIPDDKANLGVRQDLMLSGVISGPRFNEHWSQSNRLVDFYDIKGDLEAIFNLIGTLEDIEFKKQSHPALHPGQSAAIYLNNNIIGFVGAIHPMLETKLNLTEQTLIFEFLWEKAEKRKKLCQVNDILRFPINRRDIALIVASDIPAADVIRECKKVVKNQLVEINLFDVYQGKGIPKGFKSLGISLILQDSFHTLEEKEITIIVNNCVAALKKRFQASLRSNQCEER
ncbi:phenylalanine--tRNA ligase subunit beta [Sodalis sp. CWE]|uniref:phenylalanine--tRNA ligase subunit beta n=1 Tax=Sodalis sp. CWE TaxID=2803816 RepID=UPI001C7C9F46|nr:phenylalanine--tRNA ligase subunit beta [Sodalis sp. CWE]MBX4180904.1 phenylalanine--tRNA ligase subunit beta [Sodalis sp. CWE]